MPKRQQTKTQRRALREIKAILKPLDKEERIALIREIAFKLEVEAIAAKLVRAIANMDRKKK